ncbi:MAG: prepilin-type N-terminal cleavage/methylation domain-containing protein [Thermodesulfovibrio sp.]|nr:prepilin-type N-terminal cleavage/methylation domain-containing protein [Thermodesulfovibrio sp.]
MRYLRTNRGFTLVELAIVLVIIGIILGAVLKGQELIKNAKFKRLYNQYREVTAAVYTYYDKYGKYPGDDDTASSRWPGAPNGNGNGWIDGTTFCGSGGAAESCYAWEHLRRAGILTGAANTTTGRISPNHAFGGRIALGRLDSIIGGWSKPVGICFEWLNNETARWLDTNYDDGVYNTGSIRGSADYYSGSIDAVSAQYTCIEL